MNTRAYFLCLGLMFVAVSGVHAQDSPICPPGVLLSLARSGSACYGLERNQACIGNGTVESQFYSMDTQASEMPAFGAPGDRLSASILRTVHTQPVSEDISVTMLYTQANLTEAEERSVALLLLGDATLENQVPPLPEVNAYATGTLNIRRTPEVDGEIITRMAVNEGLIANGRTAEGDWLRVHVPNSNDLGWVAADVLNPQGNIFALLVVDASTPVYRPLQVFRLQSGESALCEGALPSGLLLQTPNAVTVELTINGADLQLSGTFFLRASEVLTVNALEGQAVVTAKDVSVFLPAGARLSLALGDDGMADSAPGKPEPYDLTGIRALPVNNLPYAIQTAQALTGDEIAEATAAYQSALLESVAALIEETAEETSCNRVARGDTTLWAGPGLFYEAVNEMEAGTAIVPVLETTDAVGNIWWQLRSSNWIQASHVEQSGDCEAVPVADLVRPPLSNTLSLETCETTNGPLRSGQQVIIQFIPPPWDNYGEARDAVIIDPGQVTIGSQVYWAYASEPIRLGTEGERYLRRFYVYWTAVPGTHRIVGERLSYIPICTVTVPVS